jgi:hypothetical protein
MQSRLNGMNGMNGHGATTAPPGDGLAAPGFPLRTVRDSWDDGGIPGDPSMLSRCPHCLARVEVEPADNAECPRCQAYFQPEGIQAGPPATDVSRPPHVAAPTHCVGCGGRLNNRLFCPTCGAEFCSEVCVRRHAPGCKPAPAPAAPTHPLTLPLACGAVTACLLALGCCGLIMKLAGVPDERPTVAAGRAAEPKAKGPRAATRDAFQRRFLGASAAEVRAALGAPDTIVPPASQPGKTYWLYSGVTSDPKTGKPDRQTYLWFQDDRVALITY